MKKWIIVVGVVFFAFVGWWIASETSRPKPGTQLNDLGRDHVTDISGVDYNSNPPTSGPHFAVWAKSGKYSYAISDGHLIHALEHGYIVISYNCASTKQAKTVKYAKGDKMTTSGIENPLVAFFTPENAPKKVAALPKEFSSESCKDLVSQLSQFDGEDRVVIVPRPTLDAKIALTAWTRIDKMESFDKDRIKTFIDAYRNQGPEKTME